jgi:hypothetical protein
LLDPHYIFPQAVSRAPSAYTEVAPVFAGAYKEQAMGKLRQSNRETKKQPALSPKEKKAAKQAKKNAPATTPLIPG